MKVSDDPPPGWWSFDGVLSPRGEVAAYAARKQVVKGVCRERGCFRRVELGAKDLCGRGLGLIAMNEVQDLYRCGRLDGCHLRFYEEPATAPLRLDMLVGRRNVRVRLRCIAGTCKFVRIWRVEDMIGTLHRKGKGGGHTDVDSLGKLMTTPCPDCKKAEWKADVLWHRTDTASWRQTGERVFDKYGIG